MSRKTHHSRVSRRTFAAGLGAAGLVAGTAPFNIVRAQGGPLKIGVILPLSGVQAGIGQSCKRGVDIVADSVGKAIHLACIKSLARRGVFVTCGATTGSDATTDLTRIFWNQLTVIGATMGDMGEFREVVSLFRRGMLKPVVDTVFKPADGPRAYARLEAAEQFGKIVVDWR